MTARLSIRLSAVEARLRPRHQVFLGSFEIHHTEAWPDCVGKPGADALKCCDEHGERCRKSVTPQRGSERRSIVLPGPWVPLG